MSLSLQQLLRKMGSMKIVDRIIEDECIKEEKRIWLGEQDETERSADWALSFHASSFPLYENSCGRQALYGMMALPREKPLDPRFRAYMDSGLDLEARAGQKLDASGKLLSNIDEQTNFVIRKAWLNGAVDFVIESDFRPHIVEVKSTSDQKVEEMIKGVRQCDPKHYAQCMTYIGMARSYHKRLYAPLGLGICQSGTVYYISRDNPRKTFEFFIEFDEELFDKGIARLMEWKEMYIADTMPDRNKGFMWTKEPCQWCVVKRICKSDLKDGIKTLSGSNAITYAKSINKNYDFQSIKKRTLARWQSKKK